MNLSLEAMGFFDNGRKNHAETYALLSQVRQTYLEALQATTLGTDPASLKTKAGQAIFRATLHTISLYQKTGNLPLLGNKLFDQSTENATLPPPILVALNYFLTSDQVISLAQMEVGSGNSEFDTAPMYWSNTFLWSVLAKQRFFYELLEMSSGHTHEKPILENRQVRAVQLLALGSYLVSQQLKKIGQPLQPQIFLPDQSVD